MYHADELGSHLKVCKMTKLHELNSGEAAGTTGKTYREDL